MVSKIPKNDPWQKCRRGAISGIRTSRATANTGVSRRGALIAISGTATAVVAGVVSTKLLVSGSGDHLPLAPTPRSSAERLPPPGGIECYEVVNHLEDYRDAAIEDADLRDSIAEHLKTCERCRPYATKMGIDLPS